MEFPANSVIICPSALLVHENGNATEFGYTVVETDGEEPTQEEIEGGEKRGSIVWFTQANDVMLREMGFTAGDAPSHGHDGKATFDASIFIPPVA